MDAGDDGNADDEDVCCNSFGVVVDCDLLPICRQLCGDGSDHDDDWNYDNDH